MSGIVTSLMFPTVVLRTRVEGEAADPARIGPAIERVARETPSGPDPGWACPLYTTYRTDAALHEREPFAALAARFLDEARAFARHLSVDLERAPLAIDRCWLDVLSRGDSLDLHVHPNSWLTGVWFFRAPPGGAGLVLYRPGKDAGFSVPIARENDLNREGTTIRSRDGDLVLFESHVVHSFLVHAADAPQVSLGFTVTAG